MGRFLVSIKSLNCSLRHFYRSELLLLLFYLRNESSNPILSLVKETSIHFKMH